MIFKKGAIANTVTGYDMQYTQQQRLAPEVPDESALYSPIEWNGQS